MSDNLFYKRIYEMLVFFKKDYPMAMGIGEDLSELITETKARIQGEEKA